MIPKKATGLILFLVLACGLILFSRTVGHSLASYFFGPYGPIVPYTTHIVLFQFKEGTSAFAIKEVSRQSIVKNEHRAQSMCLCCFGFKGVLNQGRLRPSSLA